MSEQGFFHKARRAVLGRSSEEFETHHRNVKELKNRLQKITQAALDDLSQRYENEDVKDKIHKKHGEQNSESFLEELKELQVVLIEEKGKFLEEREEDPLNDVEDVEKELSLWREQMEATINESKFKKLAEKYEVWGHEPVENIQSGIHKKVVHIRPAA